jgi:hypothetical protein
MSSSNAAASANASRVACRVSTCGLRMAIKFVEASVKMIETFAPTTKGYGCEASCRVAARVRMGMSRKAPERAKVLSVKAAISALVACMLGS